MVGPKGSVCTESITPLPSQSRHRSIVVVGFVLLMIFHGWAVTVGWRNGNLPGNEFRQAQTALTALFIQRDHNFSLAYPTPVLGCPWSIPMEFPLYQWVVAGIGQLTGWPLVQTGRGVSLACFYGALAALFSLLGLIEMPRARRWWVIAFFLTSPVYIFFSRAFLIETMALMFSAWFLVAIGRLLSAPSGWRWASVVIFGSLAGLVKVTTFMVFLLPAGLWTLAVLRRRCSQAGWSEVMRCAAWIIAGVGPAVGLTAAWTHFADLTKAQNSSAEFLQAGNLLAFNFGTSETRFALETLTAHWQHLSRGIAHPLLLMGAALMLFTSAGRRWWRPLGVALISYAAALILFPTLYAWHEYYSVANAGFLLTAVGLVVAGMAEWRVRWLPWAVVALFQVAQIWTYRETYYDLQRAVSPGGSDMTAAIALITDPDEQMIVAGYDWDSSVPFYSGRKALMIRRGKEEDAGYLEQAFSVQDRDRVTVFVAQLDGQETRLLLPLLERFFDIDPQPLFRWASSTVYARKALRPRMTALLRDRKNLSGVKLDMSTASLKWSLVGQEILTAEMLAKDRQLFRLCEPRPWKFYSQYGAHLVEDASLTGLFAHPDTRLWFKLPSGPHRLRVQCGMQAAAISGPVQDRSDGVEFILTKENPGSAPLLLGQLWLDPAGRPSDAGPHWLEVEVNFPEETVVVLSTGPGPAGNYTRDWAVVGTVSLKKSD